MARSAHRTARLLSIVTTAGLVGAGLVGPLAGSASAAVSTLDATPETQTVQLGSAASFSGTYTEDSPANQSPIKVAYLSGSKGDGGNGINAADGSATVEQITNTFSFSYTPTARGTDTLRFFGDNDSDNLFDAGEPFDDVSVTVAGAAYSVDLRPDADSAAVGTCNAFTVSTADEQGAPNPGRAVVVDISQPIEDSAAQPNVYFCDPNGSAASAPTTGQSPSYDPNTGATASTTRRLIVTTGTNGAAVTFGVGTTQRGTMSVVAFVDSNSNGVRDASEPSDTSIKTWTAGRADSVETVDAEPETGTGFQGQPVSITVRLTNAAGDTVPNVAPKMKITGANPQQVNCGTSNNDGVATCTYTPANAGTDTIVVFVEQSDSTTSGPDPTEPQDEVVRTIATGPAGNLVVDLVCTGTQANTSTSACVNPVEDSSDVFTATVTAPDGTDPDSARDPVSGVIVDFTISATGVNTTDDDAFLSPLSGSTGANGTTTTTLTNPGPVNSDSVTVTATIRGQLDTDPITPGTQGPSSDSATKQWQSHRPASLVLTPDVLTAQTNGTVTFTATVRDQFGDLVSGQNVDFVVENTPDGSDTDRTANNNAVSGLDRTTDENGQATFTFTDVGSRTTEGNNQVRAWADIVENDIDDGSSEPDDTATAKFINEPTTGNKVDIDVDGTCNPTTTSPGTDLNDSRTVSFDSNPSDDAYPVCALVQNVNGTPLAGTEVTFTINGVGTFVNADGSAGTQQTTAITDASGIARVSVRSDGEAGTQAITATAGNGSDTGTITYRPTAAQSRTITLTPPLKRVESGSAVVLTATVTDRFGNPVQGATVTFSETGPGAFSTGTNPQNATTNANGQATVEVTSSTSEEGSQVVTAALQPASTDCDLPADDPAAGAPAGTCSDSSTITYERAPELTITSPSSYYTTVPGAGSVTFRGTGGMAGEQLVGHRKVGNGEYTTFAGPVVAADGTWSYSLQFTTITAVYFTGETGQTATRVIKTTLNITRPSSYYTTVAKGTVVSMYGSGARPGEALYVYRKVGSGSFVALSERPVATSYGTWAFRTVISASSAFYFRGIPGNSDTVVYRVS